MLRNGVKKVWGAGHYLPIRMLSVLEASESIHFWLASSSFSAIQRAVLLSLAWLSCAEKINALLRYALHIHFSVALIRWHRLLYCCKHQGRYIQPYLDNVTREYQQGCRTIHKIIDKEPGSETSMLYHCKNHNHRFFRTAHRKCRDVQVRTKSQSAVNDNKWHRSIHHYPYWAVNVVPWGWGGGLSGYSKSSRFL